MSGCRSRAALSVNAMKHDHACKCSSLTGARRDERHVMKNNDNVQRTESQIGVVTQIPNGLAHPVFQQEIVVKISGDET